MPEALTGHRHYINPFCTQLKYNVEGCKKECAGASKLKRYVNTKYNLSSVNFIYQAPGCSKKFTYKKCLNIQNISTIADNVLFMLGEGCNNNKSYQYVKNFQGTP